MKTEQAVFHAEVGESPRSRQTQIWHVPGSASVHRKPASALKSLAPYWVIHKIAKVDSMPSKSLDAVSY